MHCYFCGSSLKPPKIVERHPFCRMDSVRVFVERSDCSECGEYIESYTRMEELFECVQEALLTQGAPYTRNEEHFLTRRIEGWLNKKPVTSSRPVLLEVSFTEGKWISQWVTRGHSFKLDVPITTPTELN